MIRLFFDCDTGIDDSVALLYLLARRDVDVVGIASTAGNVPVDVVTSNNLAWLELCGRTDVPVHVGSPTPLEAELMTTEDTHGPLGVGYAELPAATVSPSAVDAADAWIEASAAHPGELIGVVTGPLTSLATAIRRDPALPGRLARLVIMGGAFHVHGNTTPTSEWNVAVDPEAAAEVFAAFGGEAVGPPIVCPLDLTESVALSPDHLVLLAAAAGSNPVECPDPTDDPGLRSVADNVVIRHLVDALRFYFEFHHAHDEGYLAHLHDPFAVMVALAPDIVETVPARVDVELTGRFTRGMTVADERSMTGEPNARIATATDVDAVFDDLIETVGGFARIVARSDNPGIIDRLRDDSVP
ncbi:nucleoside hydrolase [Gordonia sp. HNM0687]|uniref:Nucleoside hydrolase n=1 Tax=Gordonia mangrovi TaxID=2665643 RepID=A0A6L7GRH5_9ACTN|nr:nucleoside hydrolase [Gordonia mangrovi]MDY6808665.1 nucleoside hydrolase [Actinomycetota bacterium]MXP22173.1 nucleoside hydrolase [Gordonia mangrovi]UVF77919.1 nucleoside hydrolase [Gordonia mangrovi]